MHTTGTIVPLIRADMLKLWRRRSLMAWTAVLTLGTTAAFDGFDLISHAADPVRYGAAGGLPNLNHAMLLLTYLGTVAAVLVGTTAGGQDVATGVFRDLASTGTSRVALFAARLPAALAVYLAWFVPAFAVAAATAMLAAAPGGAPPVGVLVQYGAGVGLSTVLDVTLAVGLAAALSSRSITIGILLVWELALSRLAEHVSALGAVRQLMPAAAIDRILPALGQPRLVPMPVTAAVAVLVAWSALAAVAGAFVTLKRDA